MEFCIKIMHGQAASFTDYSFPAIFNIVQTFELGSINKHKCYIRKSVEIIRVYPTSSL